ncbi:MAG: dTDP-4-dehydrorhamnose 3,5-epimerase [Candidatus Marinimicrobia bacterium]|nr:dTDP-4-dehydrorhamnose 3,5-epimerase [Candidatus Neomarinimicrobiota bacterium]
MKIIKTFFDAVHYIEMPRFDDRRGSFIKLYKDNELQQLGIHVHFKESYFSISEKNVIRGMHFQVPPADHEKYVCITHGAVRDVIMDLRKDSPTYGHVADIVLSAENHRALFIPKGFAHGFLSLKNHTIMNYLVSSEYSPEYDSGILWNSIGYDWGVTSLIMSDRDKRFLPFSKFNSPF